MGANSSNMLIPTSAILHNNKEFNIGPMKDWAIRKSCFVKFAKLGVTKETLIWSKLSSKKYGRFAYSKFNGNSFISETCHLYDRNHILYSTTGHLFTGAKAAVGYIPKPSQLFFAETLFASHLPVDNIDFKNGFFLFHPNISNFGHDVTQVLPWIHNIANKLSAQIYMFNSLTSQTSNLISAFLGERYHEYIALITYPALAHLNPRRGYFCDTLTSNTGGHYMRDAFFGNRLEPMKNIHSFHSKGFDKIALFRGNQTRIKNSHEMNEFLIRMGYVLINPIEMPVVELINRLQYAKVVIVEPGASTANLWFCPSDTKKIILYPSAGYTYTNPLWNGTWESFPCINPHQPIYLCAKTKSAQVDILAEYDIGQLASLIS